MNKRDSAKFDQRAEYKEICDECGNAHVIYTQEDDSSEYTTNIYVECECGSLVHFGLPVN